MAGRIYDRRLPPSNKARSWWVLNGRTRANQTTDSGGGEQPGVPPTITSHQISPNPGATGDRFTSVVVAPDATSITRVWTMDDEVLAGQTGEFVDIVIGDLAGNLACTAIATNTYGSSAPSIATAVVEFRAEVFDGENVVVYYADSGPALTFSSDDGKIVITGPAGTHDVFWQLASASPSLDPWYLVSVTLPGGEISGLTNGTAYRVQGTSGTDRTVVTPASYLISDIFTRSGQIQSLAVWSATSEKDDFETWLNAPVDLISHFANYNSFAECRSSIASFGALNAASNALAVWTIGLIPFDGNRADAATGVYDNEYLLVAQSLLANHNRTSGPIFVRFDPDFNGTAYHWSATNSTNGNLLIQRWQRAVNIFKGVSKRFKFIWCPTYGQSDPDLSWPGATYVDMIGMDVLFDVQAYGSTDGTAFFNSVKTGSYGLDWLVAKGVAQSKPLCIPEWGVKASSGANVGQGNTATEMASQATFVTLLANWLDSDAVVWHLYRDSNITLDTQLSSGQYPLTGAQFKIEFGAPVILTSDMHTIPNGTSFSVSLSADRVVTWSIQGANADSFSLVGSTLSLPTQTWVNGGDNTRNVTVRARDRRGLTTDLALTLAVTEPLTRVAIIDEWDGDPVAAVNAAGTSGILIAFNGNNTTLPADLAGWTTVASDSGNSRACKIYQRDSDLPANVDIPSITNADRVVGVILSGPFEIGAVAIAKGSATTLSQPALTLQGSNGRSHIFTATYIANSTNKPVRTAPAGYTTLADKNTGFGRHDLQEWTDDDWPNLATFPAESSRTLGGSSSGHFAIVIEAEEKL